MPNPNVYAREDNYDPGKLNNLLKNLMNVYNGSLQNQGASGLLPIVIDLEFKGVAGIKIGNLFNISGGDVGTDVLPVSYRGKVMKVKNQDKPKEDNKETEKDPKMTSEERIDLGGGSKLGTNLAFVVKSLSHEVSSNYWTTKLEGYPFNLDSTNKINKDNYLDIIDKARADGQPWVIIISGGLIKIISTTALSSVTQRLDSFGKVDASLPPEARAILDTLAYAEGTAGAGQNGYDILYSFQRIQNWTPNTTQGHPNIAFSIGGGRVTHAGGRYGFQYTTWTGLFNGRNAPFTAKNQDIGAWELVKNIQRGKGATLIKNAYDTAVNGVTDVTQNPNFLQILGKTSINRQGLTNIWSSIPGEDGIFLNPQSTVRLTVQDIYNVFIKAVKAYSRT